VAREAARVLAQLTAFDVLALVLVVGSIAALCGYAGGAGARLLFAVRVDRVEGALFQLLNRSKGAAGQAATQVTKARISSAEKEAEVLAAQLAAKGGGQRNGGGPWWKRGGTAADLAEEQSFAEIEKAKDDARKKGA